MNEVLRQLHKRKSVRVYEDCPIEPEVKRAMQQAAHNIRAFHAAQQPQPVRVETQPGVVCEQHPVPLQRVGLYIPGGRAPLFSTVLMLALPAKIAGCPEVILCTPQGRGGQIAPEILCAARLCGAAKGYFIGSHVSYERGYEIAARLLGLKPCLQLGMRLGEGSGCPLAFRVVEAACAVMNTMATFPEAAIDDGYLTEIRERDSFTV